MADCMSPWQGNPNCPVCRGVGGWEDPIARQSVPCYLCAGEAAYLAACNPQVKIGAQLDGLAQIPARYHGPTFHVKPWLLVIHCGSSARGNIPNFFKKTGYVTNKEGKKISVSAHIAYDVSTSEFAQCVGLDTVAWHVGGSRIPAGAITKGPLAGAVTKPLDKLNWASWGIEMQGPAGRTWKDRECEQLAELISALCAQNPNLQYITGHHVIDANKRDPGRKADLAYVAQGLILIDPSRA